MRISFIWTFVIGATTEGDKGGYAVGTEKERQLQFLANSLLHKLTIHCPNA